MRIRVHLVLLAAIARDARPRHMFRHAAPQRVEGGSIIQHIADALPDAAPHITPEFDLDHTVTLEEDSLLTSMAPNQPDWLLEGFIRHCATPAPH